ncbi:anti-sigma factor [Ornithinimicrobium pekingense]|uniref:Regulator of SigK n=1 Tax=Ornithinimicrobium pekingense TaxID=384677 RepID=A0ABQ2FAV1_9MICO|nr:anti-sigma factor [Ornithinimicrobium pekingense]GGK69564.1 hypothetical protein GCM10011509_17430 [Ornithinimicrobium pekingense]
MNDRRTHEPGEDLHDLAAPYALDALDDVERERFEEHLSACAACRAEVAELHEAAVALSEGIEVAPPADLRRRVLEQVATEAGGTGARVGDDSVDAPVEDAEPSTTSGPARLRRHPRRTWWLAAAATVVVGAGAWGAVELLGPQDPATQIVQAQDAREYDATTPDGNLTVVASAAEDAAVLRLPAELDAPPGGQAYQAWYVGSDGSARSAGVLGPDDLEDGETVLEGALTGAVAVAVTVEPEGGSQQPTSEPFVVVPLG